jgi:uncharacterized protein (TIGR03435 family)
MRNPSVLVLLLIGGVTTATMQDRSAPPTFEVASVKVNTSGDVEGTIGPRPGGYAATNVPLRLLIVRAYGLRAFQVVGGPGWIDGDRFDVVARAPEGEPSERVLLMLRTLLAERFGLVTHVEAREQPIYALMTAKADARLGPQLKPSTTECSTGPDVRCTMGGTFMGSGGSLKGIGQPLTMLATHLGTAVDRIVQDRSGLDGRYDFELSWSNRDAGNVPSIFTAVREQLGLRLEPSRGPVDVLVIDRAERPIPD